MKVFILGLDGMAPRIVESYVKADLLPNFKNVIDAGASGVLRSTIPPITGPAWISLATGKTPGKHHVFEFRKRKGYNASPVTKNTSADAEPIWGILSRNGRTVQILNVPFAYPPDKVNGIMVSGLMTPNTRTEFTFPKEFKHEISKLIPDYRIDIQTRDFLVSGDKNLLLKEVFKITEDRRRLMNHCLDTRPCDLFFVAFVGPDRLQHFMWDQICSFDSECVRYFRLLDNILGDIMKRMDDDSVLFITSDHGFSAVRKTFYVNKFFEEHGLLRTRKRRGPQQKLGKTNSFNVMRFFYKLLLRTKLLSLKKYVPLRLLTFLKNCLWSFVLVDWKNTKVFSLLWYGISVNLKGREPLGCVEQQDYSQLCEVVKEKLLNAKDPETGENIVKSVFKADELYPSKGHVDGKPDLIYVLNDGYAARDNLMSEDILKRKEWTMSGCHDRNGLLLAYGNAIRNTRINADIYDVMPTVLYLLGLAVPEDVDGRILTEVIAPEFVGKNEARFEKPRSVELSEPQIRKEEAEEVERQLRGLGYLS
jgi:predicted AlkP superfamily phosphohydrolase/phosphomutase